MRRPVAIALAGVAVLSSAIVLLIVAIEMLGGDSGTATGGATDATAEPLDKSPFCVAVRALDDLGSKPSASDGTPAQVLDQNEQFTELIDDAAANAPDDAPADVQSLFEDYLVFSTAIEAAAGDKAAATATLTSSRPELLARFGQPDAHREAFAFFAERCGTAPPT